MSRWERWNVQPKKGLSLKSFVAEGQAQQEAERQGLVFAGYGKYADPKTGEIVARIVSDRLIPVAGDQPGAMGTTAATTDTGNPTGQASGITPADRARQMGLQSDGSGGYVDPSTGQVAARTVNNELVFYSPQGGAVSDGAGGEQLTQPSPSWVDPVTGELMVPPAQPESPEEKAAVPPAVPAQAPASYNGFMNMKRKEMYAQNAADMNQSAIQDDIDSQQQAVDDKFESYPQMQNLLVDMKGIIERANASGDEHKMGVAAILQDTLESLADEMKSLYERSREEDHEELTTHIRRREIAKAKSQHHKEMQPEGSYKADDNPAPFAYFGAGTTAKEKQDEINQILDRNIEAQSFAEAGDVPNEIASNGVVYNLKPKRVIAPDFLAKSTNDALRDAGLDFRVDSDNIEVTEVDWEVEGAEDGLDTSANRRNLGPDESKRRALGALKTWRTEVLPQLSPGMIVNATAMADEGEGERRNQRERIYQLAGFGSPGSQTGIAPGMYGIVVRDETGKNSVIPVIPTAKQKNRRLAQMESIYIMLNDGILNMNEQKVVAKMLLL